MELIYYPPIFWDEDLHDYLNRLALFNGFKSSPIFKKTFIAAEGAAAWDHFLTLRGFKKNVNGGRVSREGDGFVRVCNICWEADQYLRFYWALCSYDTCHFHDVSMRIIARKLLNYSRPQLLDQTTVELQGPSFSVVLKSISACCNARNREHFYSELGFFCFEKEFITMVAEVSSLIGMSFPSDRAVGLLNSGLLVGIPVQNRIELLLSIFIVSSEERKRWLMLFIMCALLPVARREKITRRSYRRGSYYSEWALSEALKIESFISALDEFSNLETHHNYRFFKIRLREFECVDEYNDIRYYLHNALKEMHFYRRHRLPRNQ